MSAQLLTVLFWLSAVAIVVAQAMILRSTARAWRAAGSAPSMLERAFALTPALVLALVLWLSWRAATAPVMIEVDLRGPAPTTIRP
jgi:ABC-type nickel/cobalt efflux system permease component RcnA